MINNILYVKIVNGQYYYFQYSPNERNRADRFGDRLGTDGLTWTYNNKQYNLFFEAGLPFTCVIPNRDKLFTISPVHPAPDNLTEYTPTGEIAKVITAPILPTGKKCGGIYNIRGKDDHHLKITYWEHEDSWWVYDYILDIDTYEFVFEMRWKR